MHIHVDYNAINYHFKLNKISLIKPHHFYSTKQMQSTFVSYSHSKNAFYFWTAIFKTSNNSIRRITCARLPVSSFYFLPCFIPLQCSLLFPLFQKTSKSSVPIPLSSWIFQFLFSFPVLSSFSSSFSFPLLNVLTFDFVFSKDICFGLFVVLYTAMKKNLHQCYYERRRKRVWNFFWFMWIERGHW